VRHDRLARNFSDTTADNAVPSAAVTAPAGAVEGNLEAENRVDAAKMLSGRAGLTTSTEKVGEASPVTQSRGSRVRSRRDSQSPKLSRGESLPLLGDPAVVVTGEPTTTTPREHRSAGEDEESEESLSVSSASEPALNASGTRRLSGGLSPSLRRRKTPVSKLSASALGVSPLRVAHRDSINSAAMAAAADDDDADERAKSDPPALLADAGVDSTSATASAPADVLAASGVLRGSDSGANRITDKEGIYEKTDNGKLLVRAATADKLIEMLAVADALPGAMRCTMRQKCDVRSRARA
jgi:hypothetical protein